MCVSLRKVGKTPPLGRRQGLRVGAVGIGEQPRTQLKGQLGLLGTTQSDRVSLCSSREFTSVAQIELGEAQWRAETLWDRVWGVLPIGCCRLRLALHWTAEN